MQDVRKPTVTILRILYPLWAVIGMFSLMYVPSQIVVAGDAAATAEQLMSKVLLFRTGMVGSLLTQLLFIFTAYYLYKLFRSQHQEASAMMLILALVAVPIAMLNELNKVAALLSVAEPERMMFWLDLNGQGLVIASIFWGLWLFPLGYLIYQSPLFPKWVGIAVLVAGLAYTINSFLRLLLGEVPATLTSILDALTFGEVIWLLWITIRGAKWPTLATDR